MRITLAGTGIETKHLRDNYNLATGYLKSYACSVLNNADIRIINFNIDLDNPYFPPSSASELLENDPEAIGLSCYSWDIDAFLDLAIEIKKLSCSTKIIIGGPAAGLQAEEILEKHPQVDIVVIGEGEKTFAELIERNFNNLDSVEGISYRDSSGIKTTNPGKPVSDPGSLPSPYLTGIMNPHKAEVLLECSRGCIHRCRYCAWKNRENGGIRYSNTDAVQNEARWASENRYMNCFIIDSAINYNKDRMANICEAWRNGASPDNTSFSFFIHYNYFNPEEIDLLKGVNVYEINIGLETINSDVLKISGRHQFNRSLFEKTVKNYSKIGSVVLLIMLGMPGDTLESFMKTIDYVSRISFDRGRQIVDHVKVFWMCSPKGLYFEKNRKKFGIRIADRGVPYILGSNLFPEKNMITAMQNLKEHPFAKLFRWDDASPSLYYPELKGFDFDN
jgi:anaerobic magnesium-protoporphyrin IX monomethyl ester cyclase